MKNLNPDKSEMKRHWHPVLVSERADFAALPSELRLRELMLAIPERGDGDLPSTIQGIVSGAVHSIQTYLTQAVIAMSMSDPFMASMLVVSSSGQDVMNWLEGTKNTQNSWIPNYPVTGHITVEGPRYVPNYGRSSMVPAVTLSVNRKANADEPVFLLSVSVSEHDEMRSMAEFLRCCAEEWMAFEKAFGVSAFTSIPLPDVVKLRKNCSAADYAEAFVKHVVDVAEDETECLETFDLQFEVTDRMPLHVFVCAAASLLWSFHMFKIATGKNRDFQRRVAVEKIADMSRVGERAKALKKMTRVSEPEYDTRWF